MWPEEGGHSNLGGHTATLLHLPLSSIAAYTDDTLHQLVQAHARLSELLSGTPVLGSLGLQLHHSPDYHLWVTVHGTGQERRHIRGIDYPC